MSFSGGRRGGTEGPLLWLSVFPCAIVPLDLMSHKVQGSYGKGWAARLFDLFSRISHISHIRTFADGIQYLDPDSPI